jgi:hypothetical protein
VVTLKCSPKVDIFERDISLDCDMDLHSYSFSSSQLSICNPRYPESRPKLGNLGNCTMENCKQII